LSATARVLVLGTGTSHGVPMIGCECGTCRSTDPRDKRSRASILVQPQGGPSVLVDTTPDLRMQALAHGITRVDAIVYTHSHADHVMGLDEVRRFNVLQKSAIPCYGDERTLDDLRRIYSYIFSADTPRGGGVPQVVLARIAGEFCIGAATLVPVPLLHGSRPILGYRIGSFAYLQRDSRGVVAAVERRAHRRAGRAARSPASHAHVGRAGAGRGRAARARTGILHAHVPRSAARRHLRAAARGRAVGI